MIRKLIRVGVAAAALAVVQRSGAQSAPATGTQPGWTFTLQVTRDSSGAKLGPTIVTRGYLTARHLRSEMLAPDSATARIAPGGILSYTLQDDPSGVITNVMPMARMFMTMSDSDTFVKAMGILKDLDSGLTIRSRSGSKQADLGTGEVLASHPTHKYRISSSDTSTYKVGGNACEEITESTTDLWIAADLEMMAIATTTSPKMFEASPLQEQMATQADGLNGTHGLPLKVVTKTMNTKSPGIVRTTTTELTVLQPGVFPDSLFVVPAKYKKWDMSGMPMPDLSEDVASQLHRKCEKR